MLFPRYAGSLTGLLERCVQSRVLAQVLFQDMVPLRDSATPVTGLEIESPADEEAVTVRKVVLYSDNTGEKLVYAETLLVARCVPRLVQLTLRETPLPLGSVLTTLRISPRRSSLVCEWIDANVNILQTLEISSPCRLLRRSSVLRVATDGPPAMLITEWLPLLSEAP